MNLRGQIIRRINLAPAQVLVIGFFIIIMTGAVLLTLPIASRNGQGLSFIDALFTATSATCVTGLIVVDTHDYFTLFGQLVIIGLIQVGGLGFMTFSVLIALIMGKKISMRERIVIREAFNQVTLEGLVRLIRHVLLATVIIEGTGALLLSFQFVPEFGLVKGVYYSIFHAISSFCNAGFDLFGGFRSVTGYRDNPLVIITIAGLIIFGGLGFPVIAELYNKKGKFRKMSLHSKAAIVMTLSLLTIGTILIFFIEYHNPKTLLGLPLHEKLLAAFFQSTVPRTAGYASLNMVDMTQASLFLIVILMFIGACPSSTGGGIKATTFLVLMMTVVAAIKGQEEPQIFPARVRYSQ